MLKVCTWNVNGLRKREAEVLEFMEREQPDVLCLQEIKAAPDQLPDALRVPAGYHAYLHGKPGYSGVALYMARSAFPLRPAFRHPEFDHETRIVTAEFPQFAIASIYVPNGGKDYQAKVRFLDALDAYAALAQASGKALILCGDLNVAREPRDVHPSQQNPRQLGQTPDERAQFERIVSRGLCDLSRLFHPDDDRLFTWWAPWRNQRERNIGWRIDYVLASSSLSEHALGCASQREFGTSDHGPLVATFSIDPPRSTVADPEPEPEPQPPPPSGQLTLF